MLNTSRRVVGMLVGALAVIALAALFTVVLLRQPVTSARDAGTGDVSQVQTALDRADRRIVVGVPLLAVATAALATAALWRRPGTAPRSMSKSDPLTGVATRPVLHERLAQAIAAAGRTGRQFAVLFIDFDDFKRLNDEHDHEIGDRVLLAIAHRLLAGARRTDLVVRWGGDEFVVLLDHLPDTSGAATAAEKLLPEIAQPIRIGDLEVRTTASIGVAVYPDASDDPDELIRLADMAMYAAKSAGGDTYRFSTPELRDDLAARQATLRDLRAAITHQDLELRYQPQVDLGSGHVVAVEALLRWHRHDAEEPVPAGSFISLTESTTLAEPLGKWVIEEAVRQLCDWDEAGLPALSVAVNVSTRHLTQGAVAADVDAALRRHGMDPHRLELDIPAPVLVEDHGRAEAALRRLRDVGVRIVLEDFGTGPTALHRLPDLPIDALKLTGDLADRIDDGTAGIVAGIIGLAQELGLEVIVPHVERATQLARARELGCTRAQGYHVGVPALASELAQALTPSRD